MAMPLATTACIQSWTLLYTPHATQKIIIKMFVLSVFYLQCSYFPSFAVFKLFLFVFCFCFVFCSTENVHTLHVLRKMFIYTWWSCVCESLGTSHHPDVTVTVDWALKQFPFHSPGTKGRANHASKKATQRETFLFLPIVYAFHVFVLPVCKALSPWYNRTRWLGVKHQVTYL